MTAKRVGAEEARANLPELLERAHRGRATIITKRGTPYAALMPVAALQQRKGASVLALAGTGKGLWNEAADTTVARMRDEWE